MASKPFSDTEIITAVGIKLKQMRDEAQAERDKMRAEFRAEMQHEIGKLRSELFEQEERGTKRLKAPPALMAGRAN